eukprot:Skav217309  [mRNA]  locus=scaffold351:26241:56365:- [translate_table: standard]
MRSPATRSQSVADAGSTRGANSATGRTGMPDISSQLAVHHSHSSLARLGFERPAIFVESPGRARRVIGLESFQRPWFGHRGWVPLGPSIQKVVLGHVPRPSTPARRCAATRNDSTARCLGKEVQALRLRLSHALQEIRRQTVILLVC